MNGLYDRAATCMIDSTNTAVSPSAPAGVIGDSMRPDSPRDRSLPSAGTHGVDPTIPAATAMRTSFDRNHLTVSGAGSAGLRPASAFRNASAPGNVSARKKTQPTMTTASV